MSGHTPFLLFQTCYKRCCVINCPTPIFRLYNSAPRASATRKAALAVYDSLTLCSQHTSVHLQTQIIGLKNIPQTNSGFKAPLIDTLRTHLTQTKQSLQLLQTDLQSSSRALHNDPAQTRPQLLSQDKEILLYT